MTQKLDLPTPLRGGRALVRLSLPAGVIIALASVAYGLVNLETFDPFLAPPLIAYRDTPTDLVSVTPGRRSGGGGCIPGVYPVRAVVEAIVTTPDEVETGVATLIGLQLRLHELQANRVVRCHSNREGGLSAEIGPEVEEPTDWKHLTGAEKAEINGRLFFPAKLNMAGFEIEPESQIVRLDQRVWWSIRSATEGRHDGWISLGERADFALARGSGTMGSRVPLSVDVSEENAARVGVNVIAPPPKTTLILSVVGSIVGTLLASLPAWLTWFDARRKSALEAEDRDSAPGRSA